MKRQWRILKIETSKRRLKRHFFNPKETPIKKAFAIALGVFIGILPIWGFQILSAFFSAQYFKLNKPLAIIGSYVNLTPLFPLIVFLSLKIGLHILGIHDVNLILSEITLATATAYLGAYLIGSIPIAIVFSFIFGSFTYGVFKMLRLSKVSLQTAPKQFQTKPIQI